MSARLGLKLAQHIQPQRRHASRARQRLEQPPEANRLEQIIDRVHLECFQRISVEGSSKDDCRRLVELLNMLRDLESVHFRHANIEQHDIGFTRVQYFKRVPAVLRLSCNLNRHLERAVR
jgi:uncharacterized protein with von Willebrand factor type A (vWA) domain